MTFASLLKGSQTSFLLLPIPRYRNSRHWPLTITQFMVFRGKYPFDHRRALLCAGNIFLKKFVSQTQKV